MSPRVQKLIDSLPKCQRAIAARKITQAVALNWDEESIVLVTPDGATPHHFDLMAQHPVSQKQTLLPDQE